MNNTLKNLVDQCDKLSITGIYYREQNCNKYKKYFGTKIQDELKVITANIMDDVHGPGKTLFVITEKRDVCNDNLNLVGLLR